MRPGAEIRAFKTKISRSQHVQGDPLFDCSVYSKDNSYNDCLQNEINELLTEGIGCLPPLYTPDLNNLCNQKFNLSATRDKEIFDLLVQLKHQDWKSECKNPCTRSKYTSRYLTSTPWTYTALNIVFERTVDVTRSRFSINEQTLLIKLGGAVSSGRTLLWILVSILGASQVISESLSIFQNCTIVQACRTIRAVLQRKGNKSSQM